MQKIKTMNIIQKLQHKIAYMAMRISMKKIKDCNASIERFNVYPLKFLGMGGLGLQLTEEDYEYYGTTEENYRIILDDIYGILQDNPWNREIADCDNRANFVSSWISINYGLNSVARVYCEVYDATTNQLKYLHWCNLFIDWVGDIFLFDADNGGMIQKITDKTPIMGANKYNLISARIG